MDENESVPKWKKASVNKMLKITILTENLVRKRGLLAEHGLSLWIESEHERILFDTGQTAVYLHNAKALDIDLAKADAIVISHGHYDHGGGLSSFSQLSGWPRVFMHPDTFLPKYTRPMHSGQQRPVGLPWQQSELARLEHHLMLNTETMQVGENATAVSETPRTVDFESVAADLMIEKDGALVQDDMHEEQFLVIDRPEGLVAVVGCSHVGIVNILNYIQRLYPDRPIHTVMGGMHLEQAGTGQLRKTIEAFRQMDIRQIVPLHCTGQAVARTMQDELGDRVLIRCTGEHVQV